MRRFAAQTLRWSCPLALALAFDPASAAAQDPTATALLPASGRLVPVPAADVHLSMEGFWGPRVATNLLVSLALGADQLEEHGQFGNFRLAAAALGHGPAPMQPDGTPVAYCGVHFYDSDAYKWLEAACLALGQEAPTGCDAAEVARAKAGLRGRVDRFVNEIAAAQRDDGYIQTQYVVQGGEPFSKLGSDHELYCAGHLIQAAIAHEHATGSRQLLDVALRFAELLLRTFGDDTAAGQRPGTSGHPEIETALVQLSHATGDRRWLQLASYFLEQRGKGYAGGDEQRQDKAPIREQRSAAGHAVRQLYLCSGALGVAAELVGSADAAVAADAATLLDAAGAATLLDANLAIWEDISSSKLYVTGGLGSRPDGESFGAPFELPNERAYSETCASIAWMRWNQELLAATGDGRYADALETTLYNAFLAGLSLDGRSFFYVNPLSSHGGHRRQPWYWCACCPPNIMRTLAGLPGWFASTTADTLWLHLYDSCEIDTKLGDGRRVRLAVKTDYPWSGGVTVKVLEAPEGAWRLALRTPAWSTQPPVSAWRGYRLEDSGHDRTLAGLRTGDSVHFELAVEARRIAADPRVSGNVGKLALRRGPLVYAFESLDQSAPLDELYLDTADVDRREGLPDLGGGYGLRVPGLQVTLPGAGALYAPAQTVVSRVSLLAIPYFAWANRGDSALEVWMPAAPHMPTFREDAEFLAQNADAIVLRAEGCGPVVASRKLSGRVMTSAFAEGEAGFGLVNRKDILGRLSSESLPPFSNYGGEDRLWIAPEGGPWALFFKPGAEQKPANWFVVRQLDGGARRLIAQDPTSATFEFAAALTNIAGTTFHLNIHRKVEALARRELTGLLADELPESVRVVAFRSTNRMNWKDLPPAGEGQVGLWVLGQFAPNDTSRVLVPFRGPLAYRDADPLGAIKRDYFGVVPDARLALLPAVDAGNADGVTGVARFTADSRLRSKIGLSRAGATGWIGAWDEERGVLTLVNHTLPAPGAIVPDCDWKPDNPQPGQGDVATSYNDGGEPRFFELESLSAALPREAGAVVEHVSTTIHLGGDRETLAQIARAILHADL